MEEVCERENLKEALRQVKGNKGSAGVDGITVGQLSDYLKQHWPVIREQLLNGTYEPKPVRRGEIRCCPTLCSTNSTESSSDVATAISATPMIATSTCAASGLGNEGWKALRNSSRKSSR